MRWRASANEMAPSETTQQTPLSANLDDSDDVTTSSMTPIDDTTASGLAADSAEGASSNKQFHSRLDSDDEEEDELFTDDDDGLREAARRRLKRQHPSFDSADDPDDPGDSFPLNIHDEEGMDHSEPPPDDDNSSIEWRPQNSQSTCEFTHTILNYSHKRESGCKKAEYSATTVDEFGNRWRLIVYVNGNGRASNHHLSLFLQVADADDLPFGWKKAVSYVLTLEHPSGNNLSYAKRNPDKTFKLCPKAIDWGWSQFITSDRIQQESFIQDDSLTVRACVTVKSSSVTIDADDAELYLKCAVEEGNVAGVQLCLNQGAEVNCQFKDDLYTPLHTACSSASPTSTSEDGNMQVLELLLEKGADGNACNKWRETPLLIAANNGHRAAVEALLKHGADPSLCSEAGWSALTFAAHKGYDDIVALLLRAGAPVNCRVTEDSSTPLHKACAGSKPGHLTAVKQLLDGGADVHALNKWRETPLLTAANHGQAGAVEALLRAGADPCKCTDTGWSPLSIAAYKGHDDVVELLLEEGAPTEEADPTLSALLQAATKGLPATVELLLRHGADHTVTTKKGDTALSILVEQNLIDAAVEMVTEYKASVPRCSRDRKKVQRARLLINLRIKQMQRDGTYRQHGGSDDEYDVDDDAETDQEDAGETSQLGKVDANNNMNQGNGSQASTSSSTSPRKKKKKKGGKKKLSPEEQAKAAEEALLMELDQEIAQAEKVQQEASKKSAKKKKKKERERLQKQKEEQERREQEEKQRLEKERIRKEKEEEQRKQREEKAKIQREKEMEERKKAMEIVAKRREKERQQQMQMEKQRKEEQQKLQLQQQQQQQLQQQKAQAAQAAKQKQQNVAKAIKKVPATAAQPALSRADSSRNAAQAVPSAAAAAPKLVASNPAPMVNSAKSAPALGSNRGWETKNKLVAPPTATAVSQPQTARTMHAQPAPSAPAISISHINSNNSTNGSTTSTTTTAATTVTNITPNPIAGSNIMSAGLARASSDFQPKGNGNSSSSTGGMGFKQHMSDNNSHSSGHEQEPRLLGFNPSPTKLDVPLNPFGELSTLLTPQKQQHHQQHHQHHHHQQQQQYHHHQQQQQQHQHQQQYHHPDMFVTSSNNSAGSMSNGFSATATLLPQMVAADVLEHPAVALFRQEKMSELLGRFVTTSPQLAMDPLQVIDQATAKRVIYRWIVRAAHDNLQSMDCVIPSWVDFNHLTTFFHRQFIAENRKGSSAPSSMRNGMISMEALKEAGSSMANLCHRLAKEVVEFKHQLESQIPSDWSDSTIGMALASGMQNGSNADILVNWTNRSQVEFSNDDFARLDKKYVGRSDRILAAMFGLKVRYMTMGIIVNDTEMDCRLTPSFQRCAAAEAATRIELWSNPLIASNDSGVWGQFADVDCLFGASKPFATDDGGNDDALVRGGGSILVMPPMDNMVASQYMNRMVTSLQAANNDRVPLSFVVILRTQCFHDRNSAPMPSDLHLLDPRLGDQCRHFVRRAETLIAGQHVFAKQDGSVSISDSGSLLLILQNDAAAHHYDVGDMSMTKLVTALSLPTQRMVAPMNFAPPASAATATAGTPTNTTANAQDDFARPRASSSDFLDTFAPMPSQGLNPTATEFGGGIGGFSLSTSFSPAPPGGSNEVLGSTPQQASRRANTASRRWFDLVDDADDNLNDVDVVSGMLNNLNVDLFQSNGGSGQDVDIEAISLMGIGAPSASRGMQRNSSRGRFG
eukprot:CAMPEP_0119564048 /NCGR_PEP_ID=MMETSP1352-20130426/25594_1 /TAXON_ID=265584 /ORGANISM="Stauroneis constricta, Strain CCMP1120" /LENGTH=1722 /DNA_ID=CAMNT_0007612753 /DNA_START=249 /DNA_END=5417 /DNA_ORIENTATION=-